MCDIQILPPGRTFIERICQDLSLAIQRTVASHGCFSLALAGGSTPRAVYLRMAQLCQETPQLCQAVDFFWGDERTVPPDHPDSNYRMAMESWLGPAMISPDRIHRMAGEAKDLAVAAGDYERLIRKHVPGRENGVPTLDLVLLGMGDDGHTASLFPMTEALCVTDRLVVENHVPQLRTHRLTMTYPLINHARQVWFLVSGSSKAMRLREVLSPDPTTAATYPCHFIDPTSGQLKWYLDEAAAECL